MSGLPESCRIIKALACAASCQLRTRKSKLAYSTLMFAALIIGHHFSISVL